MIWLQVLLLVALLATLNVCQWIVSDQTLPFFRAFSWKTKNDWVSRVNAGVVEIIAFVLLGISGHTSVWAYALMLAFFLEDTLHLLVYDHTLLNYIHHVLVGAVFVLFRTLMTPEQAESAYRVFLTVESTGPFLQATWLMREAGLKNHPAFKTLAGFTLVFYGVMRCGVFPWLMHAHMDRGMALLLMPLLGLNVYWFYKLCRMAQKAFATNAGGERLE